MNKKLTQEDFLSRLITIYGDKYFFDKTIYINNRTKVIATCPLHGDFEKFPSNLLQGSGCKKCGADKLRKSQDKFIEELITIHGDKYTYDNVKYVSDANKVSVTCPVHGDFLMRPNDLLKGVNCPKCRNKPLGFWINKFRSVHGDFYSYDKIPYILARSNITVTCPIHGDFEILPSNHINGSGCPECHTIHNKGTLESFILKANIVHNNRYTYDNVIYINSITHVDITCPIHGDFKQVPGSHLFGHGCPKCFGKISKPEFEITEFLKSLGLQDSQILMSSSPDFMEGKQQLDIYLPEFNFAIEFNGSRWHSENIGKPNNYHYNKWKMCNENNVKLLTIWDFNWANPLRKSIYKSKISHFLRLDNRIYARKCNIVSLDKDIAINFMMNNHLEGFNIPYRNSKYIGLEYNGTIVMAAIYGEFYSQSSKTYVWKLQRICTLLNFTIVGGVSKLSNYIKNDIGNFIFQITLDTGGTISSMYNLSDSITIRYWWVNSKMDVLSRNRTQVHTLKFNDDWVEGDTENSYMVRSGYYKVFDCGIATLLN